MRLVFLIVFVSLFLSGCLTNTSRLSKPYIEEKLELRSNGLVYKISSNIPFEGKRPFIWPDGNKYEGWWDEGMMNGEGTYYSPSGKIHKESWWDGNYEYFEKGVTCKGKFVNNFFLLGYDGSCNKKKLANIDLNKNEPVINTENKVDEVNTKQTFENAKAECEAIGYKKGTEKFGECVLDLTE